MSVDYNGDRRLESDARDGADVLPMGKNKRREIGSNNTQETDARCREPCTMLPWTSIYTWCLFDDGEGV
jgi:hypothetical protein